MFHVEHPPRPGGAGAARYKPAVRSFAAMLEAELEALAAADRLRACPEVSGSSRVHPRVGVPGEDSSANLICFASNDYLGLADHPDLAAAAARSG